MKKVRDNKGSIKKKESDKFEIFFVQFQATSWKIINIHLSISYKALNAHSLRQMIHILIISLLIEKPFYLLRRLSFSFQIVSEFSIFMSRGWGL